MKQWEIQKEATFLGQPMSLHGRDPRLFVPEDMKDSVNIDRFYDLGLQLLNAMNPLASVTPWIIGSTDVGINGTPRSESDSHMQHVAWDMSPMYSADVIMPDDAPAMGLAWNLLSLKLLATDQQAPCMYVVEGDHIHCQLNDAPEMYGVNRIYMVPTISSWYALGQSVKGTDVWHELAGRTYAFQPAQVSFFRADSEMVEEMRSHLLVQGAED